ncbi:MAG: phosphoribosylformylglycinamidine synthase subunit PurQ [Chloroflexota bacterium]|nr:phosphoribosylformylglycinamidine synthase subunit PurQ [Chloroflexota bacterium]
MRIGVIVYPGSNGDHDAMYALGEVLGQSTDLIWHTETDMARYDMVLLPGGFAYGDYLRAGAIARFAPATEAIKRYAAEGGWVLGICNGFQVLTEAHLLPGALMRNAELSFSCRWIDVKIEESSSLLLSAAERGTIWRLPIAHGEGRYYADPSTLRELQANGQIVLRYCAPDGKLTAEANPNGSSEHIAGICNPEGNVLGLMPHPERAAEKILGGDDGRRFLETVVKSWLARPAVMIRDESLAR